MKPSIIRKIKQVEIFTKMYSVDCQRVRGLFIVFIVK